MGKRQRPGGWGREGFCVLLFPCVLGGGSQPPPWKKTKNGKETEKYVWKKISGGVKGFCVWEEGEGMIERSGAGYEGDMSMGSGSACYAFTHLATLRDRSAN